MSPFRSARRISYLVGAVLLATSCGGESDGPPTAQENLDSLRAEIAGTYEIGPLEDLLEEALGVASVNAGTPLGTEAFALAEATVLDRYPGHTAGPFAENIPAPPAQIADSYVQDFRNLVAFAAIVQPPYIPSATRDRFHAELFERADRTLRDLEWARNNRVLWTAELTNDGATQSSWFELVAMVDGEIGNSRGTLESEHYANEHASLLYVRDLAARIGEPDAVLAAWDDLIAAVVIANFEPANVDTRYEGGDFITRYTEGAVATGTENVRQLTAAIATAREFFPPIE